MEFMNILGYTFLSFLTYCFVKWNFYRNSKIKHKNIPENEKIVKALGDIDFTPTFYLPNFLTQLICNELKTRPIIKYQREYLTNEDGGVISLDWVIKPNNHYNKILVILHGLTGGSNTCYIRETVEGFLESDYKIVIIQYRGINDTPLFTPTIFHGGFTNDLLLSMRYIKSAFKDIPCYTIGISMGANIFTKLLVTHKEEFVGYIKGFVSLSNPYCYNEVEKRNTGTWIEYLMVALKKNFLQQHKTLLGLNKSNYNLILELDIDKLLSSRTYRDLEEKLIMNVFNYNSFGEFYLESSCIGYMQTLEVPSLFISSSDDTLSPIDMLDFNKCKYKY
jgi:predicted alpha/beta-fold hydrolase